MTPTRRRNSAAGLAIAVLVALLAGASPASGAAVTPDVPDLPAGALPHLPYVNLPAMRIVDGSRKVSISGLKGTVTALHKVAGGYVLARTFAGGNDLVMVRTSGGRKVLVGHWMQPSTAYLDPGLAVSHDGTKAAVNVATTLDQYEYSETRVVALPSGRVLHRKRFDDNVRLLGYGTRRVLVSEYPSTKWWTPSSGAAPVLALDAVGQSADLTAWQWALRPGSGAYSLQGLPPDPSPNWPVSQEDFQLGPWSLDDTMIAGNNEVTDEDGGQSSAYLVYQTSNGAAVLSVRVVAHADIIWESDSALLMATRVEGTPKRQLIRCTLAGSCERVGPTSTSRYGAIIPATRRNS